MYVFLNFKAFKETIGFNALKVIKEIDKKYNKIKIGAIINPADISLISFAKIRYIKIYTSLNKYCENFGAFTGCIPLSYIKRIGIRGLLLNHFENQIKFDLIKKFILFSKKNRLETIVCVKNLKEAKKIDRLNPNYIALEIPELIGTRLAVSKYKTKNLKKFVKLIKNIPICGAGISKPEDVKLAREIGTKGVLIGSSFAKSKNKIDFLKKIDEYL